MTTGHEIRLTHRPQGWPTAETFNLVEIELGEPGPGQALVRNVVMSVDPYMRGRMSDAPSYVAPFEVGKALDGGAVGEVVVSNSEQVKPGDVVLHNYGWRDFVMIDANRLRVVDTRLAPPSAYLGALGMPGLTAYVGLLDIASMRAGDVVFVSGAAGAVGALVGQIARLRGAKRVIGSVGSAAKVDHVTRQLGFDTAFVYRDAPVRDQLKIAAPEGIDVYFDNVGGEHLEAAIGRLNVSGRVALCGAISQYNEVSGATGPRNLALAIGKRLSLRGFIVSDHADRIPEFTSEMGRWLAAGEVRADETYVDGLAQAPAAFLAMLRGENTGKMLVRLTQ